MNKKIFLENYAVGIPPMKKVLVTGANSMIGRPVCRLLRERNYEVHGLTHEECDLLDVQLTKNIFNNIKPDGVIHLATYSGNLQFNSKYPADTFYKTSQIALNVLQSTLECGAKDVLSIMSSCAIADIGKDELKETDLWAGMPNHSIESHGFAKRMLDAFSRQLYTQHGLRAKTCILTNCYGPYDSFSIEKTKVVGALIKRFTLAKQEQSENVLCWGSGRPLRELMYAPDAAEAIIQCFENYHNYSLPLNIGSDQEVSIKDLSQMIASMCGYEGEILWDLTKTDGQLRKKLDTSRMKSFINMEMTSLLSGLAQTISWYKQMNGLS
jgi:GDP-L-fucose synthase